MLGPPTTIRLSLPRRTTLGRPETLSALRRRLILSNLLVFLLPTVGVTAALVILASIVNPGLLRRAFTTNLILVGSADIGSFLLAGDERSNGGRSSHWRRALLISVITVTIISTTPNNTSHHLRIGEGDGDPRVSTGTF